MKYQLEQERHFAFNNISKSFFNLFSKDKKEESSKNAGYEIISNEFDKYLKNELCYFAFELIENGYKPSKLQSKNFISLIEKTAHKNGTFFYQLANIMQHIPEDLTLLAIKQNPWLIYNLIELNKPISAQVLFTCLKENLLCPRLNYGQDREIDPKIISLIKEHVNEENVTTLLNEVNDNVRTNAKDLFANLKVESYALGIIGYGNIDSLKVLESNLQNYTNLISIVSPIAQTDDIQIYKDLITEIKDNAINISFKLSNVYFDKNENSLKVPALKNLEDQAKKLISQKLESNKAEIIKQTKILSRDVILEKKVNDSISNHHITINNELPKDAKDIIQNINDKYNVLSSDKNLNEEDKLELKNLYENRLPQIVKKFLVIDKEYRTELKNVEGKNAEQLMVESLDNIYHVLNNKLENINVERLSDLSATKRYTNAIRNKI